MKEMTTAEFAKANLAALAEPVSIRRYTKVVGTYYPQGYEPAAPPPVPTLGLEGTITESHMEDGVRVIDGFDIKAVSIAAETRIRELEEDNRHLKQLLAAKAEKKPVPITDALPESWRPKPVGIELLSQERRTVPRPHRDDDPFAGLAPQDRAFFERRLGKPGKKSGA